MSDFTETIKLLEEQNESLERINQNFQTMIDDESTGEDARQELKSRIASANELIERNKENIVKMKNKDNE